MKSRYRAVCPLLLTLGCCLLPAVSFAAPAAFYDGINFAPYGNSQVVPWASSISRESLTLETNNGGLTLYSGLDESVKGMGDGGITLWGNPVSIVLQSASWTDDASFKIWNSTGYNDPSPNVPIFNIDGATQTATFSSNVLIGGSLSIGDALSVGGSPVLTSASAPTFLTNQGFLKTAGPGGPLNISSTTLSTSSSTGALTVAGGLGVGGDAWIDGVRIGTGAGNNDSANTALGQEVLSFNTTGNNNTASGNWALNQNTTGSANSAFGAGALLQNTTGNGNTATGNWALWQNTTGDENTATGESSLYSNISGVSNTASGCQALFSNITGDENTASGEYALYSSTTGSSNTASGYCALGYNTTGSNNTASGGSSLFYNDSGSNNAALGGWAGGYNVSGSGNVFIGSGAGLSTNNGQNISPNNSIYIGNNATGLNDSDLNTIVVGAGAISEGANTTVIGNTNTTKTHLFGTIDAAGYTIGGIPLVNNLSSSFVTQGNIAPNPGQTIGGIIAVGTDASAHGVDAMAIGVNSTVSSDNSTAIGNQTCASGAESVSIGYVTGTSGNAAIAIGSQTGATGDAAIAIGQNSSAFGNGAISIGFSSSVWSDMGVAIGNNSCANNYQSFACGNNTTANGFYSTSIGYEATANGDYSTTSGYLATANGNYSSAQGAYSVANGACSTAQGSFTTAASAFETTSGRYNLQPTPADTASWNELDGLFRVGNGDSTTPSDAVTVLKNGQTTLTNKAWKAAVNAAPTVPATALADPGTGDDSGGEALVVAGHTRLKGKVIIEQPQGDISMGIYGDTNGN